MDIPRLARIAAQHHGVIHRDHAGLTPREWYGLIERGLLVPMHPNVAHLIGVSPNHRLRIAAALSALGGDAVCSHRSAAYLWGLYDEPLGPVDVILPDRAPSRRLADVRVHRPRDQQRLRPILREGIACTDVRRTLLDLGAVDRHSVSAAVGRALVAERTTLDQLLRTVIEHSEHGRHGIVALRAALDDWAIDGQVADSVLEMAMVRLVRRFGLPAVEFHPRIEGWEIDFRVVGTRVLIECDGWLYHGANRRHFERDQARRAHLAAAGWIVVPLTYRMLISTPKIAADKIRSAARTWAEMGAPDDPAAA